MGFVSRARELVGSQKRIPARVKGYIDSDGYRHVWIPADHPMAVMRSGVRSGFVKEHRLIAALMAGRPLRRRRAGASPELE
jgi:hypothetical protein